MIKEKINRVVRIVGCCVALLAGVACAESDCVLTGRPTALFNFYDVDTMQPVVYADSITITALQTKEEQDTVLVNRASKLGGFSLPLSYVEEESIFEIRYGTYRDTLRIKHTNMPHFISMECGRKMFYHIESITYTKKFLMDSIIIKNRDIDDYEKENFQMLFKLDM